jgi:hypothetical protein
MLDTREGNFELIKVYSIRSPTTLLALEWYPFARYDDATSWCFVMSSRDVPVRLIDAYQGLVSDREEKRCRKSNHEAYALFTSCPDKGQLWHHRSCRALHWPSGPCFQSRWDKVSQSVFPSNAVLCLTLYF